MKEFAYFREQDSEQFKFYRIPKVLFTDRHFEELSSEAKILYGIMLDRVSLSRKNGWIDEDGNIYILFKISEMMEHLKWTKYRILQLLAELDSVKGIGLIERRKSGLCKPNVIYVKNFASILQYKIKDFNGEAAIGSDTQTSVSLSDKPPEVCQSNHWESVTRTPGSLPVKPLEVCQSDRNNTNISNTNINDTELSNTEGSIRTAPDGRFVYGTFQNVKLTEKELKEIKRRFPSDWQEWIEKLSAYIASSGKDYQNHYATICRWAWREKKPSTEKNYDIPEGKGF